MAVSKTKIAVSAVIFAAVMIGMTIVCEMVWEACLGDQVYLCTDPLDGYLTPDNWVGNGEDSDDGYPIVFVDHLVDTGAMNDPDELKMGWSVGRLWYAWYSLFGLSLIVSLLVAVAPWTNLVSAARRVPAPYWIALAVIVSLLVAGFFVIDINPPRSITKGRMLITARRIIEYAREHNELPANLADLPPMPGYDTSTNDGWGRPLRYSLTADPDFTLRRYVADFTLTSLGADNRPGGAGDNRDITRTFSARDSAGAWKDHPFTMDMDHLYR